MSAMKQLMEEVEELYRDGYTILAIARQLKLSITEVQEVVNNLNHTAKE